MDWLTDDDAQIGIEISDGALRQELGKLLGRAPDEKEQAGFALLSVSASYVDDDSQDMVDGFAHECRKHFPKLSQEQLSRLIPLLLEAGNGRYSNINIHSKLIVSSAVQTAFAQPVDALPVVTPPIWLKELKGTSRKFVEAMLAGEQITVENFSELFKGYTKAKLHGDVKGWKETDKKRCVLEMLKKVI